MKLESKVEDIRATSEKLPRDQSEFMTRWVEDFERVYPVSDWKIKGGGVLYSNGSFSFMCDPMSRFVAIFSEIAHQHFWDFYGVGIEK